MGKLEKHILDISLYYNQIQWFRFTSEDDMKWYKYKDELKNVFTGELYSIQHYVIGRWFSPGTSVSSTNKSDSHDITEILLKVALCNIIPNFGCFINRPILMSFDFPFVRLFGVR
jgi:hypothetical protein